MDRRLQYTLHITFIDTPGKDVSKVSKYFNILYLFILFFAVLESHSESFRRIQPLI